MERIRARHDYAALTGARRCAALLITVEKDGKQYEEWRFYHNPTIGDMQSLRRKGAIIMRQLVERHGNQVDKTWVTDSGMPVVVTTEFLRCDSQR